MDLGAGVVRKVDIVKGDGDRLSGRVGLLCLAVTLTIGIFVADTFTALVSAVAVLYVLVIVLAAEIGSRSAIWVSSIGCAVLTVLSFAMVHGFSPEVQAVLRLLFSLAANAVTTALLLRRQAEVATRKMAELQIIANEYRYRTIFDTLAVAVWEHDFRDVKSELVRLQANGVRDLPRYLAGHPEFVVRARQLVKITDVNETALRLMGVETKEDFFRYLGCFLPENDQSFAQCLVALDEGHLNFQAETKVRDVKGKLIPVIVTISFPPNGEGLDRIQGSIVDITERLHFQESMENSRRELEHASRAAMIGEVSASIAHEVNQPLATTVNYIQAAQRWLDRDDPDLAETKIALREALSATQHAAAVVKRVRMLLGKAKPDTGEISLETTLLDAVRIKRHEIDSTGTKITFAHCTQKPMILGDRVLLQQVFINIITNAIQAMDATAQGERHLIVETTTRSADVMIRVTDTGPGLGADNGEGFFKAFNTTKPAGMGLGLAMCRSIVISHGGTISIRDRTDGLGAIVEMSLPCIPHTAAISNDNSSASQSDHGMNEASIEQSVIA